MGQIFSAESPSSINGNDFQSKYTTDVGVSNDHLINVTNNSPSQSYIDIFPAGSKLYSGYAVIFNHQKFKPLDSKEKLKERFGTDNDVKALKETFKMFNIFVDVKQDLTFNEIEAEVDRIRIMDFTELKCFFIVILTHGEENNELWARDEKYKLVESIVDPIILTNNSLKMKPKFFIIQACRGTKLPINVQTDSKVESSATVPVPSILNMMFIFSTYEGHVAFRDTRTGGYFIQMFCKMIKDFGHTESITNLMERVTDQLYLNNEQQVPTIISTMRESFCFGKIKKQKFGYVVIYYENERIKNSEWNEFLTTLKMMNIKLDIIKFDYKNKFKKLETFDFTQYDYLMILYFSFVLFTSVEELILKENKSLDGKPKIIMITMDPYFKDFYKNKIEQLNISNLMYFYFDELNFFNEQIKLDSNIFLKFYNEIIPILTKMIKIYGKTESIDIIMKYVDDELRKTDEFKNSQLKTYSTLKEPFYICEK